MIAIQTTLTQDMTKDQKRRKGRGNAPGVKKRVRERKGGKERKKEDGNREAKMREKDL